MREDVSGLQAGRTHEQARLRWQTLRRLPSHPKLWPSMSQKGLEYRGPSHHAEALAHATSRHSLSSTQGRKNPALPRAFPSHTSAVVLPSMKWGKAIRYQGTLG
jgi:hypothetical protein